MTRKLMFWILSVTFVAVCVTAVDVRGADDPWSRVKEILSKTQNILVLDGTETSPLKYEGEDDPVYGDWLVRHFLSDPENFNPYTSSDASASTVQAFITESLLFPELETPYAMKGQIAKAYPEISEDKLKYTFDLRDDVRFSDGKPLTAEDVLFSMKVIQNPKVLAPHLRNYFAAVKDAKMEGKYRIAFYMNEPYFRNDVALGRMDVLPKHFYDPDGLMDPVEVASLIDGSWEQGPHVDRVTQFGEAFNTGFNRNIMGSGPYIIADWEKDVVTGQKVVLTRNPAYWGTGKGIPPALGYVDKIVFKIVNNTDAAFIELTNGDLDYYSLKPLEFKDKSWSPEFVGRFFKAVDYSSGYLYVGWNNAHPIFGDKRVRRAMTHLTDRDGMIQNLLFGLGEPVEGPIDVFRPEYNASLKPLGYDPDRALDLLAEAGWDDTDGDGLLDKMIDGKRVPFSFEILVNSGNQMRKDIALVLQNELSDIGVGCEVRELDWSIFLDRVKSKEYDAMVLGWTSSIVYAPDAYQIWHSSQAAERGSNHIAFKNDEVDRILDDYRLEFDFEKRKQLYQRFQEILHEEQPYTFLWKSRNARAYSRRFRNVNWYSSGSEEREWFVSASDRMYDQD
jgi:peptide/nickel transport system substrate-binding protein